MRGGELSGDGLPSAFGTAPAGSWTDEPDAEGFSGTDADRYVDGPLLGEGGMGRVWSVWDNRLRRTVARKEVRPDTQAAARLAREAWVTAALEHPGIVHVLDAGTHLDGTPWYTMPLIRGRSLSEASREGDLEDRLRLVRHLHAACEAMAYAHQHFVIHRDLKPENIMVGAFGETLVVDWGLARPLDGAELAGGPEPDDAGLTRMGSVIGTPAYMSPEQARGEPATRASDVWSLGMVLRELLVGEPALRGSSEQVLDRVRLGDIPALQVGPPELQAVVRRCLCPGPEDRYPDAGGLAADLLAWLEGRRVSAHAYGAGEVARRFAHAWRWPLRLAGALVALGVVGTAIAGVLLAEERDRALAAEQDAREQASRAEAALGDALITATLPSFARDDRPSVQRLARQALSHVDPDTEDAAVARGLLAGFPPTAPGVTAEARCPGAAAGADLRVICAEGSTVWTLDPAGEETWRHAFDTDVWQVFWVGDRPGVRARTITLGEDLQTWGPAAQAITGVQGRTAAVLERSQVRTLQEPDAPWLEPCPVVGRGAAVPTRMAVLCSTGDLLVDGRRVPLEAHAWLGLDLDEEDVVAVATGGWLAVVTPDETRVLDSRLPMESPDRVVLGDQVIGVSSAFEGVVILRRDTLEVTDRLPAGHQLLGLQGSRAVTHAEGTVYWWDHLGHDALRLRSPNGLSGIVDHDDAILGADGGGFLTRWRDDTGAIEARVRFGVDVLKPPAVVGGDLYLAPFGGGQLLRLDANLEVVESSPRAEDLRRLGTVDGQLVGLSMGGQAIPLGEDASQTRKDCYEIAPVDEGLLLCHEGLFALDGSLILSRTDLIAVAGTRDDLVLATREQVEANGWAHSTPSPITALDAGDTYVVAGLLDGSARVWDRQTGALQLVLRGHIERVSGLVLRDDRLWTASWDHTVRTWWLGSGLDPLPEASPSP